MTIRRRKQTKNFQSFTWRLLAWQVAQSRKVSEREARQRKNEEGKNDAPKRVARYSFTEKSFCSFNFLLLSKRLKASLGNRVYFTHAYLLSIFSDLWGAIFASSLENTLSWVVVHIVRPLVKETQCEWRVFDLLFSDPWWSVQQCQSEKFTVTNYLTINRKKFLYDILSPLKYHCKKDTVSRVFDVSKRQRLLFCLVLYLGHYMIPLCKISYCQC